MLFQQIRKKKVLMLITVLVFLLSTSVAAQTGTGNSPDSTGQATQSQQFKDEELKTFANVMKRIQKVQSESNQEIESAFEDSSMSKQRFNKLFAARKNQNKQKADDETQSETKEFNKLAKQIQTIQKDSQKKMIQMVRDRGLTIERFNTIVKAIRANPEVGKRVKQFM